MTRPPVLRAEWLWVTVVGTRVADELDMGAEQGRRPFVPCLVPLWSGGLGSRTLSRIRVSPTRTTQS